MPRKPSSTSNLLRPRKEGEPARGVTSERIAIDLAAFRKAGGRIEVLGVTRTLKHVDVAAAPVASAPTPPKRRGAPRKDG
jgi:hypothetical protein